MATIFDSLKGLITPELISQASSTLSEDNGNVTKAVTAAIPAILGSILAKGNHPGVESALKEAGSANGNILSNITNIFSGNTESTQGIGGNLLNSILGDKLGGLTSLISSVSGISSGNSSSLLSMITPVIGGFLGNKMSSEGLNLSGLLGQLGAEKSSFLSAIPAGLTSILGISSLSHLGDSLSGGINKATSEVKKDVKGAINTIEKKKNGWLKWLIPILLILLGIITWRACGHKKETVENISTEVENMTTNAEEMIDNSVPMLTELSLPDGTKLQAYKGGIEDQIITFLSSDEYKNDTPEALKEKWFNFDNINFEFGSANKLTAESYTQIDNIVAILKHFKDAKVKLGGYTDKKGDAAANLKLSQERANTMKKVFTEKGIGKQIAGAEGYGDKFATIAADASDEERSADRKMALRFEK